MLDLIFKALCLALALLIACRSSPALTYYVKLGALYAYIGVVMGPATWMYKVKHGVLDTMAFCVWTCSPILPGLGVDLQVSGADKVKAGKPYVIVLNHQHLLDGIILNQLLPALHMPRIVMKAELQRYGPVGKAFEGIGGIFVKRGSGRSAIDSLIDRAKEAKEGGYSIVLFPEGTRHSGPDLLPFKKGAFFAAVGAQIPVLPVVIHKFDFLDTRERCFGSGQARVQVLDPIPTDGLDVNLHVGELADKCRSVMSKVYAPRNE